jgi:hypothetical protein
VISRNLKSSKALLVSLFRNISTNTTSISPIRMTSVAAGLLRSLPKPKYTGEDEELPSHAQPRGPKVLGAGSLDETQVVVRVSATTLSLSKFFL